MRVPICIDFETYAAEGYEAPKPVGLAIKWPGKAPKYLSWGHPTKNNCTYQDAKRALCEVWDSDREVLGHNMGFDLKVAYKYFGLAPLPWKRVHDTLFLLFLNDPHSKSLGLKESAERLLGLPPAERGGIAEWLREAGVISAKQKPGAFICKAPGAVVAPYAIGDVTRTLQLFNLLLPKLDAREREAYDRERRLLPILMENAARGLRVDMEGLQRDDLVYSAALVKADAWLRKALKTPSLNLEADREVAEALRGGGIVTQFDRTPTGKDSVSKKTMTLDRFSDPRIFQVLGYRNRVKTVLSQSIQPWLLDARGDGRIRTEWNQVRQSHGNDNPSGARTGRLSCSRFMNISKSFEGRGDGYLHPAFLKVPPLPLVRDYILPEKGELWLHRDLSQQEFRIVAHFADGQILADYQANPKLDYHTNMQERLAGIGVTVDRSQVKAISFGILYGAGAGRLAEMLKMPLEDARALIQATKRAAPDITALDKELIILYSKDRI